MVIRTLISLFGFLFFFPAFGQMDTSETYTVLYFRDGITVSSEGNMLDGKPNGYWKTYHPNGQIKSEGNRVDFKLDGPWIFYNETGDSLLKVTYIEGVKNGERITYVDGRRSLKEIYLNDQRQGNALRYYASGSISQRTPFVDDSEQGNGFEYSEEGRLITLFTYKKGVLVKQQKVNRFKENGDTTGFWMWFYPDSKIQKEGSYSDGLRHGYFKYYDEKGNLRKTEKYIEGVLQPDAPETAKMRVRRTTYADGSIKTLGGYRNGTKDGVHRSYNEDGNVISSQRYELGILLSEGILDAEGREQGPWVYFYPTGEKKAEGAYKDGKKIDQWKYYHRNGKMEQTGRYQNDLPVGLWNWYFDDGSLRREEEYFRGLVEGPSIEYNQQGEVVAQGEYLDGYKEGPWIYHMGDHKEIGNYIEGQRQGNWKYYYSDTEKLQFEGSYTYGIADGKHKFYWPNGKIRLEGKYIMGQENGDWVHYNELGEIELYITYEDGKEVKFNGLPVDDLLGPEK